MSGAFKKVVRKVMRNTRVGRQRRFVKNQIIGAKSIYRFKQWIGEITLTQSPTIASQYAQSYTLAFLDQVASFTALFDQYRIDMIEVHFRPQYSANALQATSTNVVPLIYTVIDYDDDTALTSLAAAREYQNCMVHQDKPFSIRYKPHVAQALYSGVFTSFGNTRSPWIDMASTAVKHYGWKCTITPGATGQTNFQSWNVSTRLHFSCKNVR